MRTGKYLEYPIFDSISGSRPYLVLFILWPFLAFIAALSDYTKKDAKKVVYLFLIYYGLSYFIGGTGMDSGAYVRHLEQNALLPFSDFFRIVSGLYATDTSIDIGEPFISFVISRFTNDYRVLFGVFAAIYGFFYLKSINLLYERYIKNPGWNAWIFMVFFVVVLSIYNINGFRMWTAAWIFFFGAYHVILYEEKKFLLLALSASLLHWSFLTANAVLLIYFFAGNRNLIYWIIAAFSFILPEMLMPVFDSLSLKMGGAIQNRFTDYSSDAYILSIQDHYANARWFLNLSKDLVFYYLLTAIIVINLFQREQMAGKHERNLFSFLLLFISFINFGKPIPSFGNRFQIVFLLFASLYVFLYFIKIPGRKISFLTLIGLFPMLLYAAVEFRIASDVINSWIFLPLLGLPLFQNGIPLSEFLF
jgi:hypothetical protein